MKHDIRLLTVDGKAIGIFNVPPGDASCRQFLRQSWLRQHLRVRCLGGEVSATKGASDAHRERFERSAEREPIAGVRVIWLT